MDCFACLAQGQWRCCSAGTGNQFRGTYPEPGTLLPAGSTGTVPRCSDAGGERSGDDLPLVQALCEKIRRLGPTKQGRLSATLGLVRSVTLVTEQRSGFSLALASSR